MRKKTLAGALATLALGAGVLLAPTAAFATPVDENDNYTPGEQTEPSLTGSIVTASCHGDAPYISYDITLTDPDDLSTSDSASLFITDGSQSITLPLGTLQNDRLAGKVLWPGASVGPDGKAASLPGWMKENGVWRAAPENFGWTRGDISAQLRVNPTLDVPLHADFMEVACENGVVASSTPGTVGTPAGGEAEALAATGQVISWSAIGAGIAAVGAGTALLLVRRRRSAS